jgi:hypothetical protein
VIALTLLTRQDRAGCTDGNRILAELSHDFPLHVEEVDLNSHHGPLPKRAQRRDLTRLTDTN